MDKKQKTYTQILCYQYLIATFFWILFTVFLFVILYTLLKERTTFYNDLDIKNRLREISNSKGLLSKSDFLNEILRRSYDDMDYVSYSIKVMEIINNNLDILIETLRDGKDNDISYIWNDLESAWNLTYFFCFISTFFAIITSGFYLVINVQIFKQHFTEKKYQLSTVYKNNYVVVKYQIYVNSLGTIAIIFSVFNLLTILMAVIYGFFILIATLVSYWIFKIYTPVFLLKNWWKSKKFYFYFFVLIFTNAYSLLKLFFRSFFTFDFEGIVSNIIPQNMFSVGTIGTFGTVVTIYIKKMLNSSLFSFKKQIKDISLNVEKFKIYASLQNESEKFNFNDELPLIIKKQLLLNESGKNQKYILFLIKKLNSTFKFLQLNVKNRKKLNYLLFHIFTRVKNLEEIKEIKSNVLKLKNNLSANKNDFKELKTI